MRPLVAVLSVMYLLWGCIPAIAHPHLFVGAKERVVFDKTGEISEIRNSWVFDQAYSAWAIQGIDIHGSGSRPRRGCKGSLTSS